MSKPRGEWGRAQGRGEGEGREGAEKAQAHSHPRQAAPAAQPLLVSLASPQPLSVPVGGGQWCEEGPRGALASPRNCVFQSGTTHNARGASLHEARPCPCAADPTQLGSPANPSLAPGGHPSLAAPYLLTSAGHAPGHVSLSGQGLTVGSSIPGPTRLCEDSLGDLWPATLRGCIPRLSRHWPKKSFKARTSQSLADSYTHPPSHPFLAQPCSLTQGPVWWEGVSMTPLF